MAAELACFSTLLHPIYGTVATCFMLLSRFTFLRPWRWRRNVPPKYKLNFNGLYSALHSCEIDRCVLMCLLISVTRQNVQRCWLLDLRPEQLQWHNLHTTPSSHVASSSFQVYQLKFCMSFLSSAVFHRTIYFSLYHPMGLLITKFPLM
jgi:hypothetical protein